MDLIGKTIYGPTVSVNLKKPDLTQDDPTKGDHVRGREYFDNQIAALRADMEYVPIEVTNIQHNAGTVEMGRTVDSVKVSWTLNKAPAAQTVNGNAVDVAARSVNLTGLGITATTDFTVSVEDERGAKDAATTKVYFYNGIYCGSLPDSSALDSAAVLSLTRKLQSGKATTFAAPAGRPTYALPSRYGTPSFNIGGFDYTWTKAATIQFENASGYVESYDIWQHPQLVSDSVSIKVE